MSHKRNKNKAVFIPAPEIGHYYLNSRGRDEEVRKEARFRKELVKKKGKIKK